MFTGKNLISFSISKSGDMAGSVYTQTVMLTKTGTVTIKTESAKAHNLPLKTTQREVDAELLRKISEIYSKYKLESCKDAPMKELLASDAATTSYSFIFEGLKCVRFISDQKLSEKALEGIEMINNAISMAQ